jgi:hypothetical protein
VPHFKFLGTTVINLIHEEIKMILDSGNSCYHSAQNILSSRLLFKSVEITIYKTIFLLVVLYGCGTFSLTLMEGHRLRVFENRALNRIFGPRREVTVGWRKLRNEELHDLYCSSSLTRMIKSRRVRWK